MKILVTGGGGFLGSFICERLLDDGHTVYVLDYSSGDKVAHLKDRNNFHYYQDSVLNVDMVRNLVDKVEMVFHFAAIADPKRYVQEPLNVLEIDLMGTLNVLKEVAKVSKKFIFASTSEVYGKNPNTPWKESDDRLVGSTSINRWCYSTAKAVCEHYIYAYQKESNLPFVIFRFFNVYGPRVDELGFGRVIPIFLENCFNGKDLPVHGDGSQTRSFTYIEDCIDGVLAASFAKECENETFNIGSDNEITIKELAETLIRVGNFKSKIKNIPHKNLYGDSYEDVPRRAPDISKIEKYIGWKASTALEEGLRNTIEYFKNKRHIA